MSTTTTTTKPNSIFEAIPKPSSSSSSIDPTRPRNPSSNTSTAPCYCCFANTPIQGRMTPEHARSRLSSSSNSWSQSTRRSRSSGEVPPCQQANSTPGQAQKAESSAAPCARALTHREGEAERLIATCGSPTGPWPTMLHQWFLPQARMDDRPCP